ncbi:transcriptional regulator, TetR family [Pseudoxanthomonas sp. GM95]|uniref:TetR/AcrR family transcriptional regulator n=1 Tax=Pseudoxanthomonas sp. GM95 TaxID=1881043 RepID=UPI0008D60A87|nr:TetR/AcrR family transcriptional regulator [Pseudoxanthomonas sp. GM95]SEM09786.1 transcriptional regulator, TetR family [Pseudoxanthomonas sp. GM95]
MPSPSAPKTTAPQRLTDRKRQAIVESAIEAFRTQGFDATSMDRIAADAGVSKRTVYNHFPSKDALFAEILAQLWGKAAGLAEQAYAQGQPLRPQLLALMQQKLRMLEDEHFVGLARVAIAEAIHAPERAREMVARMGDKDEGITVWIRAAIADGALKKADAQFASHQLQSLIKGFAFWPQLTMGQSTLTRAQQQQVAESAVDMFLAHYATKC